MSRLVQRYLTGQQQLKMSLPLTMRDIEPLQKQIKELRLLTTCVLDDQSQKTASQHSVNESRV